MKKLAALLLALALLFTVSAQAEDAYMRQINQTRYVNTLFITPESYPQVCLAAYYPSILYSSSFKKEPLFASFSQPENTAIASFDMDSCFLLNEDENIQYNYQLIDNYSFETLLNKCDNDAYIIFDGSDKKAAYLAPDSARAYGLISVPEIAKGAKLYISIYLGGMGRSVSIEKQVERLTQVITQEVNRVEAEIQVTRMDPHWSVGRYTGLKMLSLEYGDQMLVFDFPEVTAKCDDGTPATAQLFPISLDDNRFEGYVCFNQASGLQVDIEMGTYSYVEYQKEENPKEVHSVTMSNGAVFDVYAYGLADGSSTMVYASHILARDAGYDRDRNYYLTIELHGNSVKWTSVEEIAATLESIVSSMGFANPDDDPYVPSAAPAAPAAPAASAASAAPAAEDKNAWACPGCSTENTGNFCANCGTKKPEDNGAWACPGCGTENTGNFCTNCGTKKP